MPNFVPVGGSDAAGYDAARLTRLRTIKTERDPEDVIRSKQARPDSVTLVVGLADRAQRRRVTV